MEASSPLHHAVTSGRLQTVRPNIGHKNVTGTKDNEDRSIPHQTPWGRDEEAAKNVPKKGADMNSKTKNGWTALHEASWQGHDGMVRLLLRQGTDPNEVDNQGQTASHQAAWRGHAAVLELLLEEANADLDREDKTGQTPLHHAASNGPTTAVRLLLDKGADPRATDNNGRTPHSLAEENFHHRTAKLLRDKEAEIYGEEVPPDFDNIPKTSHPSSRLDSAVIAALSADPSTASIEAYGQASSSIPSKISTSINGESRTCFMEESLDGEMFKDIFPLVARCRKTTNFSIGITRNLLYQALLFNLHTSKQ